MHLKTFQVDKIQNGRLSAIIHLDRPHIAEYSRYCHQRPCSCQTKKVVGDRKSLVTGVFAVKFAGAAAGSISG